MPINNFEGETFVAFLDISGFKELMQKKNDAWKALDRLYSSGYGCLRGENESAHFRIEGIFISDSGVLFVRNNHMNNMRQKLQSLLKLIKSINKKMLDKDFMLTTSIAYGKFKYRERIEFSGIDKSAIYGNAYISAFADNETGNPRIQPGQCRIVKENLPKNIIESIEQNRDEDIFRMIRKRDDDNQHFYYYWMCNNPNEINRFEQDYIDAYNLKYAGMLKALKNVNN